MTARIVPLVVTLISWAAATGALAQPSSDPFFLGSFTGAGSAWPDDPHRPRLVVVLVLDQFRGDYLDRFDRAFGRGGFRRLREGFEFADCTIPYAQTLTGPGFATLLTGATPRVHGIVGNSWWERASGRSVGAQSDSTALPVPVDATVGASPRRLRAQTVGDALRAASQGAARVVSISEKERSAALAGGHHATGAFWLEESRFRMQTSTYYASVLPEWAVRANDAVRVDSALALTWEPLLPPDAYWGTIPNLGAPGFPHRASTAAALAELPYGLESLFDFARAAVDGERLGADAVPDLLVLGVSITDFVGHTYGPESPEVLDMAARVDREIATLLSDLDRKVGRDRYTIVLTSDHGVSPIPPVARAFHASRADSVGGIGSDELEAWADSVIGGTAARGPRHGFVRAITSGHVYLDERTLRGAGLRLEDAARALADAAAAHPSLARGFTRGQLAGIGDGGDLYERAVRAGYDPERGGDVVLVPSAFAFFGGRSSGTSHGTPYRYDTHVPFVLYGAGVRGGRSDEAVSTLDIAPTIAALLGIEPPAQCEGRARRESLRAEVLRPRARRP